MAINVVFTIQVDDEAIRAAHTLREWIDFLNLDHDAFTEWTGEITWNDIYRVIAADYHAGGDYDRYVVEHKDEVNQL